MVVLVVYGQLFVVLKFRYCKPHHSAWKNSYDSLTFDGLHEN